MAATSRVRNCRFAVSSLCECTQLFIGDQNTQTHHIRQRLLWFFLFFFFFLIYSLRWAISPVNALLLYVSGTRDQTSWLNNAGRDTTNWSSFSYSLFSKCCTDALSLASEISLGATPDLKTNFSLRNEIEIHQTAASETMGEFDHQIQLYLIMLRIKCQWALANFISDAFLLNSFKSHSSSLAKYVIFI